MLDSFADTLTVSSGPTVDLVDRPVAFAVPEVTEDDVAAVVAVLRSGWITTGTVCQELETALAAYLGVRHAVATSSCTTALECAVAGLRLPAGSRVAVPSWTFVSTVTVLLRLGLQPVLVDSDPDGLGMSPEGLQAALASGLRAVVPVHFAGGPVQPDVHRLAGEAGLPVVEDAAHALGAALPTSPATMARCYSLYATKNLTSAEGGAVATDDDELAEFVRAYRQHGMSSDAWRRYAPGGSPTYDLVVRGTKANLPDVLAALGLSQLRRFATTQARRRALVHVYRQQLSALPAVRCVPASLDVDSADHLMVVLLPEGTDRAAVIARMAAAGITTSVHFRPVHHFTALRAELDVPDAMPVCDRSWPRALSLPLHPGLSLRDVQRVVQCLGRALA